MSSFEQNVIRSWGEKGRTWLKALPKTTEHLARYWNLTELKPVENLSYNYVLKGYQDTTPIVLKLSCDTKELNNEQSALTAYNGISCIRLLASNPEYNALLLEQAIPGTTLVPFFPSRDDEALEHTVSIMKQLHKTPLPEHLPSLKEWFRCLFNPHPVLLNIYHIRKAQELVLDLLATQEKVVLLHGDLHHGNILLSNRGWLAIDPKGILGDPAYEPCSFMKNPNPETVKDKKLILYRLERFSELLSIDKERLYHWFYAQSVLDACWAFEEGETTIQRALASAEIINSLRIK